MANKNEVLELFKKNPLWSSVRLAEELECESAYVRATLSRNGLKLAEPPIRRQERQKMMALGKECMDAGFTLSDIRKFARDKSRTTKEQG